MERNTCELCAYFDLVNRDIGMGWCLVSPPVFRGTSNCYDRISWSDPVVLKNRLGCRYFKQRIQQQEKIKND